MPTTVVIAEDVWAGLDVRQRGKAAAAYACTPIHRCLHCGRAIDLRIDEATLQVTVCLDSDGGETGAIKLSLCHSPCAPSQLLRMPEDEADRRWDRWWGTSVGDSWWALEAVESAGQQWPLMLVELATTDVLIDETPGEDGTYGARSGIIYRMHQEGFVVPGAAAPLAQLPLIPSWEILTSSEGRLQAVTCPPGSGAGSSAGVLVASDSDTGMKLAPEWRDAAAARQEALLFVVPPATLGQPRHVSWDEDRDAAVRSAIHLMMQAVSQRPSEGLLAQVPLLAAIRDGRIAAGRVPVRLDAPPA